MTDAPRRRRARRLWLDLHLAIALLIGIVPALLGASGALLV